MEKKSFIGLVLIMLLLFLYPFYMAKLAPPSSPKSAPIIKTTSIQPTPDKASMPPSYPNLAVKESDTVHDTVLENNRLQVTLSNQGAGVKMIRLIRFKEPDGENGITLFVSDSSDKNLFTWTKPFLGYELERVKFAFQEAKNRVDYKVSLPNALTLEKSFILEEDTDLLKMELRVHNLGDSPLPIGFSLLCAGNLVKQEPLEERYLELVLSGNNKLQREFLRQIKKAKDYAGPLNWLAIKNKYFCEILTPSSSQLSYTAQQMDGNLAVIAHIPARLIEPGGIWEEKFILYAGALDTGLLAQYNPEWQKVVHFGAFDSIAKLLLSLLKTGFLIFRNYGWAIILLSLLVNIALFPFTWKGMKSMQRLQALQPQIEQLRKEHGRDPQRLNKETLELYRKNKVNPFGGCLPLVLQMPVFIALYQALSRAIELKGAHFLWIKDLAGPDALIKELPFLGKPLNLLPLLMVVGTYLQQKKTQGFATTSQKQMTWFMPLFMGLIFYTLPSGLILYWVTSTFLTLGLQSWVHPRAQN